MEIIQFIINNWEFFLLAFYVAEKIIRLTPTKKDDIIFDMIIKPLWKMLSGSLFLKKEQLKDKKHDVDNVI